MDIIGVCDNVGAEAGHWKPPPHTGSDGGGKEYCTACVCAVPTYLSQETAPPPPPAVSRGDNMLRKLLVLCFTFAKLTHQLDGDSIIARRLVRDEALGTDEDFRCRRHRRTVLHWAAEQHRDPGVTHRLFCALASNKDVASLIHRPDALNYTPLAYLLMAGSHAETIELAVTQLGALFPPDITLFSYLAALVASEARTGVPATAYMPLVHTLLDRHLFAQPLWSALVDIGGNTILHLVLAARVYSSDIVRRLLRTATGPAVRNKCGETPLHILCQDREPTPLQSIEDKAGATAQRAFIATTLLCHDRGDIPTNVVTNRGETALHYAAKAPYRQNLLLVLLTHGADPMLRDVDGNTALHLAWPNDTLWRTLLVPCAAATTALLSSTNNAGETPLSYRFSPAVGAGQSIAAGSPAEDRRHRMMRLFAHLGAHRRRRRRRRRRRLPYGRSRPAWSAAASRNYNRIVELGPWQFRRHLLYPPQWRAAIRTLLAIHHVYQNTARYPQAGIWALSDETLFYVFALICAPPLVGVLLGPEHRA
jgi:hypothetical protein